MRIGIDFDDVVADTMAAIVRIHNKDYRTSFTKDDFHSYDFWDVWGGTREEAIKKVDAVLSRDQIEEIEPMKGALAAIRELKSRGHELYIITGRATRAIEETERWLLHHLPGTFAGTHYASHYDLNAAPKKKSGIGKELGIEVMIDDSPRVAEDCAAAGIKVFLFDAAWNRKLGTLQNVTRVHSWEEILTEI